MKALIYKSTGSWYIAKGIDEKFYNARIRGNLKIDGITSTNPVAVGDIVEIGGESESNDSIVISEIYDRKNYIVRISPHNRNQRHIIASNLDQSMLFATLKDPKTSQGFIDRFLVSSEAFHIPAIVIINKADVYKRKELERFEEVKGIYEDAGYRVVLTSMVTGQGIADIKALLENKTTLLSGHSGVGKSTFINTIFPDLKLKTQQVSEWSGKGTHTTTFAEMFDLPFEGKIIDTPGVRELAIADISKQELSHYFPEMRERLNDCQFNNCMHMNEPGCAIKNALNEGQIHEDRYVSYLTILETMDGKKF